MPVGGWGGWGVLPTWKIMPCCVLDFCHQMYRFDLTSKFIKAKNGSWRLCYIRYSCDTVVTLTVVTEWNQSWARTRVRRHCGGNTATPDGELLQPGNLCRSVFKILPLNT